MTLPSVASAITPVQGRLDERHIVGRVCPAEAGHEAQVESALASRGAVVLMFRCAVMRLFLLPCSSFLPAVGALIPSQHLNIYMISH